jgi:4-diphosphocytidyl-2-C-methyl-D-erythritol kinase
LTDAPPPGGAALTARAKLNLYLHLVGRRADGYHELDSLVAFASCGDRLSVAPADRLTLHIEGPFAEALEAQGDNLVLKAARLLRERFAIAPGAEIRLEKRLPVAAGLGGGSADAAATLLGLARLWGIPARPGFCCRSRRGWEPTSRSAWPASRSSWGASASNWSLRPRCRSWG